MGHFSGEGENLFGPLFFRILPWRYWKRGFLRFSQKPDHGKIRICPGKIGIYRGNFEIFMVRICFVYGKMEIFPGWVGMYHGKMETFVGRLGTRHGETEISLGQIAIYPDEPEVFLGKTKTDYG